MIRSPFILKMYLILFCVENLYFNDFVEKSNNELGTRVRGRRSFKTQCVLMMRNVRHMFGLYFYGYFVNT